MHPRSITPASRRKRSVCNAVSRFIEELEPRRLLSETMTSDGWTVFNNQDTDGKKIYVSSSTGSDTLNGSTNPGTDPSHPIKTLAAGYAQMRSGHADWMLLMSGDSWNESLGFWAKGGPSGQDPTHPTDPMLIGYYGYYTNEDDPFAGPTYYDPSNFPTDTTDLDIPARPVVHAETANGSPTDGLQFVNGSPASHIAVDGISFDAPTYNGKNSSSATGLRAQLTGEDYLIEDCSFTGFKDNVTVGNPGTPVSYFTIRRSEVLSSYNEGGGHSQGMYVSGSCSNITIEENTFDHNGWKVTADKTEFNHNMYINTGATNILVTGNTIAEGSLRGTLLRAGGTVTNNFYDQNAVAIQVGNTASIVTGNVILEGDDLPTLPSGVGIDASFDIPSVNISNNIIAHDDSSYEYNVYGIDLDGGTRHATVQNNIVYDWRRTLYNGDVGSGNTIQNNTFEDFDGHHALADSEGGGTTTYGNNTYFSAQESTAFEQANHPENFASWVGQNPSDSSSTDGTLAPFVDPNRDMGTYNGSLGGSATFAAWIASQRAQSRATWDPNYTAASENAYIQQGFSTTTIQATSQTITVAATDPNASELGPDTGTFTVTRSGSPLQLALPLNNVLFDLEGSATLGSDYDISSPNVSGNAINFPAGAASIQITVTPHTDNLVEGDETVKLNIRSSGITLNPPYVPGNPPDAIVTIADATTAVNVTAPVAVASQTSQTPGDFNIARSGPTTSALTVQLLVTGEATYGTDYSLVASPTVNLTLSPDGLGDEVGTATFAVGASSIDISVVPVNTGILHGPPDANNNPTPGQQTVGLTVESDVNNPATYQPGISTGATVTIFDGTPTSGGGSGGLNNPPPTGHGLDEQFFNQQDLYLPDSTFTTGESIETVDDTISQLFGSPAYGPVDDTRPGFNFTGAPHAGVNADHFTADWTGQFQAEFEENYTFSVTLDPDATAKVYIQDDSGDWTKVLDSGPNHMPGDVNDDAQVNAADFNVIAAHYNQHVTGWANGDLNGDGVINASDFALLASNYGKPDTRTAQDIVGIPPAPQTPIPVDLEAGVRYNVVIEYSDRVNTAGLRFLWQSNSQALQEVPLDRLYASTASTAPSLPSVGLDSLFSTSAINSDTKPGSVLN